MQGYHFQADFPILPLDNYVMILGIQWSAELSDVMWNFKQLQMKFHIDGEGYLLQGESDQGLRLVSKENMHKLLPKETQLSLTQCFALTI